MKKLLMLALAFVLCACGGATVKTGSTEYEFEDYNSGAKQKVMVSVELEDDKITKIEIDETYNDAEGNPTTKRTLGDAYNMKGTSAQIGAIEGGGEWYEQIDHLQEVLVGTDGTIALDEAGKPTDAEVLAGCTINLTNIAAAVEEAVANAK